MRDPKEIVREAGTLDPVTLVRAGYVEALREAIAGQRAILERLRKLSEIQPIVTVEEPK